jgi:hypothetical protein
MLKSEVVAAILKDAASASCCMRCGNGAMDATMRDTPSNFETAVNDRNCGIFSENGVHDSTRVTPRLREG